MASKSSTKREVVQFTSYSRKLRDNIKSMMDNYGEILKAAKVPDTGASSTGEYDAAIYHTTTEIQVRAANMVKAAEALLELVAELKEYLILNDFSTINDSIIKRAQELKEAQKQLKNETDQMFESYKQHQLHNLGITESVKSSEKKLTPPQKLS